MQTLFDPGAFMGVLIIPREPSKSSSAIRKSADSFIFLVWADAAAAYCFGRRPNSFRLYYLGSQKLRD
jgi:hypothetical protein